MRLHYHGRSPCGVYPALTANNTDAQLIHEAAIGKIAGDQLIKLMTLGLTEEEAEERILKGFLHETDFIYTVPVTIPPPICICIDSLLTGGDRVEIIIVDDGSSDETGAIADAYAAKYPDTIKVIHQEKRRSRRGKLIRDSTCPVPLFQSSGQRRLGQRRGAAAC